jgi:hypothetical protein
MIGDHATQPGEHDPPRRTDKNYQVNTLINLGYLALPLDLTIGAAATSSPGRRRGRHRRLANKEGDLLSPWVGQSMLRGQRQTNMAPQ